MKKIAVQIVDAVVRYLREQGVSSRIVDAAKGIVKVDGRKVRLWKGKEPLSESPRKERSRGHASVLGSAPVFGELVGMSPEGSFTIQVSVPALNLLRKAGASKAGGRKRGRSLHASAEGRYAEYRKEFLACRMRADPSARYSTIVNHTANHCHVSKKTIERATRDLRF